jgi:hypothetical protein
MRLPATARTPGGARDPGDPIEPGSIAATGRPPTQAPGSVLRLRKSTTVFVRTGELMVTRNGRSVVVRHGGLAAGAWDRPRGHLQRGLDISGMSPDSSRALPDGGSSASRTCGVTPDHVA